MSWRWSVAVSLAAGLWPAVGPAHGQSVPQLRAAIDDTGQTAPVATATSLEIKPADDVQPVRRKRKAMDDPYAPVGIRVGGITLYPSLSVGSVATSNVRQATSGAQSAIGLTLKPALRFASDWVRHSWTGGANLDLVRYLDQKDITSQTGDLFSTFRLDIRRDTRAEFGASYNLDQTGLSGSEVPATAVGNRTEHLISGAAALIHDFGPLEARAKAGIGWKIYDDVKLSGGGTEDNSDRDYAAPSLSLRATYTDPPVFKPYVEAAYEPRFYQRKLDRNGLQRSSQGYAASAGVVIGQGPIWSGDLAATYLVRDYKDAALATNDAVGLSGSVTWSPSDLTRVVLSLGTSLSDTVSTTASGSRNWTGRVDLTQGLRDNIDVLAGAGVAIERGSTGDDVTYDANLGLAWKLGPSLAWTAGYDFTWLDAAGAGRSYTEHRISAGLTLSR